MSGADHPILQFLDQELQEDLPGTDLHWLLFNHTALLLYPG